MSIPVMRYKRNKFLNIPDSPVLNYLKLVPGHTKFYTTKDIAEETEVVGGMSAEDVEHVVRAFIRSLRKTLTKGDKVKVDGLGTFYITFSCEGAEDEKDCTIKSIKRVNIRFNVDNTLRLANDSNATTRGAANNVEFYIKSETSKKAAENNTNGGNDDGNGNGSGSGDDDDFVDPGA